MSRTIRKTETQRTDIWPKRRMLSVVNAHREAHGFAPLCGDIAESGWSEADYKAWLEQMRRAGRLVGGRAS